MWGFLLGCLALVLVALGFVLHPWLWQARPRTRPMQDLLTDAYRMRRDELQEDVEIGWLAPELYGEAESELDRGLLDDAQTLSAPADGATLDRRWMAAGLAAAVLILSGNIFLLSEDLRQFAGRSVAPDQAAESEMLHERLLAHAAQNPDDVGAWMHLGRFYRMQGRGDEAAVAWARANELRDGSDPSVLASLADAMAMAAGDRFSAAAIAYLTQALALDPEHRKALLLAGLAARQQRQMEAAAAYWERLLAVLPPEQEGMRVMVEAWIAEAGGGSAAPAAAAGPALKVSVTLDPALARGLDPETVLFVYARHHAGPPMPLAIWRGRAADLPLEVTLDDRAAMAPGMALSDAAEVDVLARLSFSGEAQPQSGDLLGVAGPVAVAADVSVALVIDRRVP